MKAGSKLIKGKPKIPDRRKPYRTYRFLYHSYIRLIKEM